VVDHAWEFYECSVDDHRAFLAIDLDIAERAPDPARPLSVRVLVPLLSPRDDGLPHADERPRLDEIEDTLVELFLAADAVHVGRASFGGAMRHYFYAPSEDGLRAVAVRCRTAIGDREITIGSYADPDWEQYFQFLYPNELGWQYIHDRRVLDALREEGDDLERPRKLDHEADFPSTSARERFATRIGTRGFTVDGATEAPGEEMPYRLQFSHELAPIGIFDVTIELRELASSCGGHYDGWGCPVVRLD